MIAISSDRFATGDDSGVIIIWDSVTGMKILEFNEHKQRINCLLAINVDILVSGSIDKTIRIWDLSSGECISIIEKHTASVTCLVKLGRNNFVSGGNDGFLYVWENSGSFIQEILREDVNMDFNLTCMIIVGKYIVTGSMSNTLYIYNSDTGELCDQNQGNHRESINCLEKVDDTSFISGSMDGVVSIWSFHKELQLVHTLNHPRDYRARDRTYNYSVRKLLLTSRKFIAACIGNGFKIYNMETGEAVLECTDEESAINDIILIDNGYKFITCSSNAHINVWESESDIQFNRAKTDTKVSKKKRNAMLKGDMRIHNNQVMKLLKISETCFASAGFDSNVIIWKDGEHENIERNRNARLYSQLVRVKGKRNRQSISNDTESYKTADSSFSHKLYGSLDQTSESDYYNSSSTSGSGEYDEHSYLLDEALYLHNQRGMSIEELCIYFENEGHSKMIIDDLCFFIASMEKKGVV
eukprot:TRINITY_DN3755_c0_g1_i1.p1 TRINITY_DN3755_c0_g1~~TRINITY_DN3755_c0_g1_i1.p1  ORF type:complete len:470 (+),score=91.71 TRINITY_DN3755_c0_g1_i1:246-1655(+)